MRPVAAGARLGLGGGRPPAGMHCTRATPIPSEGPFPAADIGRPAAAIGVLAVRPAPPLPESPTRPADRELFKPPSLFPSGEILFKGENFLSQSVSFSVSECRTGNLLLTDSTDANLVAAVSDFCVQMGRPPLARHGCVVFATSLLLLLLPLLETIWLALLVPRTGLVLIVFSFLELANGSRLGLSGGPCRLLVLLAGGNFGGNFSTEKPLVLTT